MTDHPRRVTRALLSVSDKSGLIEFARALGRPRHRAGLHRRHRQGDRRCRTEGQGCLGTDRLSGNDGRAGQDAASEGAWRAARDPRQCRTRAGDEERTASRRSIFWWSISIRSRRPSTKAPDFEECIENIDIGGPAMIRAAAKNHDDVAVVVEAQDYQAVLDELAANAGRDHARRCAGVSPPKPMPAPPPMTPRSRTGLRLS